MLLTQSESSRDGILAARRVPPQLLVMISMKAGGFSDAEKAKLMFMKNKVVPIQARMSGLKRSFRCGYFSVWLRQVPRDGVDGSAAASCQPHGVNGLFRVKTFFLATSKMILYRLSILWKRRR